jgi:hypothetical protein
VTVQVKSGTRLRSAVCGTEIIVVRSQVSELDLRCGGQPMLPHDSAPAEQAAPEPGYDEPTSLGKRYADDEDVIEVLCTVAGPSTLTIGERPLSIKGPRPLPASD